MTWLTYLVELHRGKDLAYGDAWCRRGEVAGIFPNVARKYDRWNRIRGRGIADGAVEPLDDTLADLLIYAVKWLVWLLEREPEVGSLLPPEVVGIASVNAVLSLITKSPTVDRADELIVESFETLEALLARGAPERTTAGERGSAVWSLARGSWAALRVLPTPVSHAPRQDAVSVPPIAQALHDQLLQAFTLTPGTILLLGYTPTSLALRAQLGALSLSEHLLGIAHPELAGDERLGIVDWRQLSGLAVDYLVVASDVEKEELLGAYVSAADSSAQPTVILAGAAHLEFRDPIYAELDAPALVPSYATGYPYTRIHMFQHLEAAAANGLSGAIVEFGAFKGGTTAWLARVARHFGLDSPIIAFDSWDGFPARRSVLDMYTHSRCIYTDIDAVRAHLEPLGVELVPGDISDTAPVRLADEPILLAFVDTDNYSPAAAALTAVIKNVVPGGAVVFDHYTTTPDYLYTLGERMAGRKFLDRQGFFQIHGTGVFVRLPSNHNYSM